MLKKISSLFLIKPEDLNQEELSFYKEYGFKNFILFKEHFKEDFTLYLSYFKEKLKASLLATDQEGGRVCRIEGNFLSPLEIAKKYQKEGEKCVRKWAKEIALSLKRYHLNLNLAPSLDLADESAEEFLKGRTFGKNKNSVEKLAYIFIEEHKKEKIFTCLKHFPGLKDVKIDPHEELPFKENLDKENLDVFSSLLEKTCSPFIMTTHIVIKEIDLKPVTFSEKIVSLLRKNLNYKNVILTDDLSMKALSFWELQERIILSLASGHNILIYCGKWYDLGAALEDIESEINKSLILREKIKESFSVLEKILK